MEFILGLIVIIVLLLILGVDVFLIVQGILWLMELLLLAMTLFFVVSAVFVLMGKRCDAEFIRIEKVENLGHAIYRIDGEERKNFYPAEFMLRSLIYRRKTSRARFWQRGKFSVLFDWYSILIAALGLPLSAAGAILLGRFLLWI